MGSGLHTNVKATFYQLITSQQMSRFMWFVVREDRMVRLTLSIGDSQVYIQNN